MNIGGFFNLSMLWCHSERVQPPFDCAQGALSEAEWAREESLKLDS